MKCYLTDCDAETRRSKGDTGKLIDFIFVVFGSVCQRSIFTSRFHASADLTWQRRALYFWLWYLCEAQVDEWKLVGTASSLHVFVTAGVLHLLAPVRCNRQVTSARRRSSYGRMKPGWTPAVLWVSTSASRQRGGLILSSPGRQNGGPGAPRGPRGGAALARLPPRRNAGAAGSCSQQKMLLISAGCDFSFICGLFDTTAAGACAYTQEVTERRGPSVTPFIPHAYMSRMGSEARSEAAVNMLMSPEKHKWCLCFSCYMLHVTDSLLRG